MFVFTDPMAQRPPGQGRSPKTDRSAAISIGSPIGVPVPCASMSPMLSGVTSATSSASAMTRLWPSTPGAVNPTFSAPSLLTADPFSTAQT